MLLLVSHAGAGPKHLGHPPLHSLATAESWPGRGATGTESGAPNGTRTRCAGAARQRISLVSRGAGLFFVFYRMLSGKEILMCNITSIRIFFLFRHN